MEENSTNVPFGAEISMETSSFRDPDARVFYQGDKVYRKISKKYSETYRKLMNSGLYKRLLEENLIVPHNEIKDENNIIIEPKKLFISYPWEWCFSEIKDAALATLKIQKIALEFDMSLKDATPYNIQFMENSPVLIDTSSFEDFEEKPWVAYRQFCENFLAPLALIAYTDLSLTNLFLGNINGVSLSLTAKLLPFKTRFNFNLLAHIFIHSKMQDKYSDNKKLVKGVKVSKGQLLNIIQNLEDTIKSINLSKYKTEWEEYYSNTNYTDDSFKAKKDIIEEFKRKINPKNVWDMGCNTGVFSRIFSDDNICVKAFDIDRLAIERAYLNVKEKGEKNLFPLIFDISNPSPALGFNNSERKTLIERTKYIEGGVDLTLALALIHHLRITYSVPFDYLADYFSKISKYLIIEFVQKEDSKIQTMLLNREDIFDDYTKENFEDAFSAHYNILDTRLIPDTRRIIYLMERK